MTDAYLHRELQSYNRRLKMEQCKSFFTELNNGILHKTIHNPTDLYKVYYSRWHAELKIAICFER